MKFKPLKDKALVEAVKEDNVKKLILEPETSKKKPQIGIIKAVGPGRYNDKGQLLPMSIKVNDKVYFGKYAGAPIKIKGKEYILIQESDIIGIFDEKKQTKKA